MITKTELPKTLRSVQCHRKRILSANCEALRHLDKLRITAKCISVKMCNSIAFADVSMTSHFIGDFVFGLSTDRIMIRYQLQLSYCLQWTTDFTATLLVPNPIPIRVVTLPSTDVSDRYRQKLRFPEISKTNQAMSL